LYGKQERNLSCARRRTCTTTSHAYRVEGLNTCSPPFLDESLNDMVMDTTAVLKDLVIQYFLAFGNII